MSRKVWAIVVAALWPASGAWAWSTAAHQEVTLEAINALPGA